MAPKNRKTARAKARKERVRRKPILHPLHECASLESMLSDAVHQGRVKQVMKTLVNELMETQQVETTTLVMWVIRKMTQNENAPVAAMPPGFL